MTYVRLLIEPSLLTKAQIAMGMSQEQLGKVAGVSRRTMVRWQQGDNGPSLDQWVTIARRVYRQDRAVASEIAQKMGESLESLGLEAPAPAQQAAPPARPMPPIGDLVDSIVCAAAEAVTMTPQAIRPAVLAAFDRAASVAVTIDEVRGTMRGQAGKGASKR